MKLVLGVLVVISLVFGVFWLVRNHRPKSEREFGYGRWRHGRAEGAAAGFWIFFIGAIIAGMVWVAAESDRVMCRNTAAVMGIEYSWSTSTGCLVEHNGEYVDIEQVGSNRNKEV